MSIIDFFVPPISVIAEYPKFANGMGGGIAAPFPGILLYFVIIVDLYE